MTSAETRASVSVELEISPFHSRKINGANAMTHLEKPSDFPKDHDPDLEIAKVVAHKEIVVSIVNAIPSLVGQIIKGFAGVSIGVFSVLLVVLVPDKTLVISVIDLIAKIAHTLT